MYEDTRCVAETRDSLGTEHLGLRATLQSQTEVRITRRLLFFFQVSVVSVGELKVRA